MDTTEDVAEARTRLIVYLPRNLNRRLREYAYGRYRTANQVTLDAIKEFLDRQEQPIEDRQSCGGCGGPIHFNEGTDHGPIWVHTATGQGRSDDHSAYPQGAEPIKVAAINPEG